ncbi:MAG TPA: PAS domain-containing sensor histidine kinase [Gemmataceae bacterium]|nr:PAS domain-containing sensor histidine kinase [Gemmataceae bacterium]
MPTQDEDELGEALNVTLEELRTAEEELRTQNEQLATAYEVIAAERQRYHELFNFAPDGYLVTDAHGTIRDANVAAMELLGRPRRYLVGKPVRVFVHSDAQAAFDRVLNQVRDSGGANGAELLLNVDGLAIPVSVHVNAAGHPEVGPPSLRWLVHNLTDLKAAQGRAARADRLAAVGQAAAALGHECRTALQRAKACLSMLRLEAADRPKALDLVERTNRAVDDLTRMVEDVRLAVSRPHLRCEPCGLRAVWRTAWEQTPGTDPAGLVEAEAWADAKLTADPFRLRQVFTNLFSNSLAAGAQQVTVRVVETTLHDRPALRVSVRDDGPGLSPEQQQHLFEPFYTTRPDGTGLGLTIVRSIVEAHSGTVIAADVPVGTEIVLTLPRGPS